MDDNSFGAMRDAVSVEDFPDRQGLKCLTDAGGWRNRWNHYGGRGCLKNIVPHDNFHVPYVRAEEEGVYDLKLGDLLDVLDETGGREQAHGHFSFYNFHMMVFGS